MSGNELIRLDEIRNHIYTIRGVQVILDRDLAELYDVPTKVMNQAVKRNIQRFPNDFRFQLTEKEKNELVTDCDRFEKLKHSSTQPYAFTEQGVAMLSAVLRSETAVRVSIQIIQAFVKMRKVMMNNALLYKRIEVIERKQLETDEKFELVFKAIESKDLRPKQGIFFNGQIFDAYQFVSDLFRSAKKSIVIIDNYLDDSVLVHLSKRKKGVHVTLLTKNISRSLVLDVKKFNKQYPQIEITQFNNSHDRFIVIDETIVYHFGASLKDLGKKWFAFSKMEIGAVEMLAKLDGISFKYG